MHGMKSPETRKLSWLGHDVSAMRDAVNLCKLGTVPQAVRKVLEHESWREFWLSMRLYQFETFAAFITTDKAHGGCGWDPKYVAALIQKSGDKETLAMWRAAMIGKQGSHTDNISMREGHGTSLAYTLDRLKRENEELYSKVVAGKMSANAAAIEAGIRRLPSSLTLLRKAWAKASPAERRAFLDEVER